MTRSVSAIAMLVAAAVVALVCVLPGVGAADWGCIKGFMITITRMIAKVNGGSVI